MWRLRRQEPRGLHVNSESVSIAPRSRFRLPRIWQQNRYFDECWHLWGERNLLTRGTASLRQSVSHVNTSALPNTTWKQLITGTCSVSPLKLFFLIHRYGSSIKDFDPHYIFCRSKSRGDWILVMHATIRRKTFCPLACCQEMWRLDYTRL
jgi:hypothetical protein